MSAASVVPTATTNLGKPTSVCYLSVSLDHRKESLAFRALVLEALVQEYAVKGP